MTGMELAKTPSLRLDGKRALISGAGRGIGLAAATALADAGAQVTFDRVLLVNNDGQVTPDDARQLLAMARQG